jgi:hypothetical protein
MGDDNRASNRRTASAALRHADVRWARKIKKGLGDRGALGVLATSETLKTREESWPMLGLQRPREERKAGETQGS